MKRPYRGEPESGRDVLATAVNRKGSRFESVLRSHVREFKSAAISCPREHPKPALSSGTR